MSEHAPGPLRLLAASVRKRGLADTLAFVLHELLFDLRRGTDTRSPVALDQLDVTSEHKALGVWYQPAGYAVMRDAFDWLRTSGWIGSGSFVDFGCGKGRALIVALEEGYDRVVGLDFAGELLAAAERNLLRVDRRRGAGEARRWQLVLADAAAYDLPEDASTLFFYNPFACEVMEKVLDNVERSLAEHPRPLAVVYINPKCRALFLEHGFREAFARLPEVAVFVR